MTIELMRRIDYWLGIPLCFLLHVVNSILRLVSIKRKDTPPRKILFIKLSELGAVLLSFPLIAKIKKEYPETKIYFLTFRKNSDILKVLNLLPSENVLTIRDDYIILFLLDTLRVIIKMQREGIDTAFDLEFFSRFTSILTYLSGAQKKVGFFKYTYEGLYRGNLLSHNIQYNPLLHVSKMYLSLAEAERLRNKYSPGLEEKVADEELILPRVYLPEVAKENIKKKLKNLGIEDNNYTKLILMNPGEGNIPLREWPLENFIMLSKMLLENKGNRIVIVGKKDFANKAERLFHAVNNRRCISLVGKTMLVELLALFEKAEALITNDCGLAHLASLVPIKKFVFFGPESPKIYSPLGDNTWIIYSDLTCSPCLSVFNHRNSACKDNKCLKIIEPVDVYKMIKNNL